jgi:hypothetical protein
VPVILGPGCAGLQPLHQFSAIRRLEYTVGIRRRHAHLGIVTGQALKHLAVGQDTRTHHRLPVIQAELCLARLGIRAVAVVTGIGKHRTNVPDELIIRRQNMPSQEHCRRYENGSDHDDCSRQNSVLDRKRNPR